jgi:parallel beta-helix repeat protein
VHDHHRDRGGIEMSIARVPGLALVAGLGLLVAVSGTDAATAPAVTCGATLTKSTTLSADLVHCPGTALVIGADGITVDLGGHTISGTNADGSEGIASDGHAKVRIVGGRITDFRINGVGIRGGSGNLVRGVTVRRIGDGGVENEPVSAGIAISRSPRSRVIGNDVSNDVDAFQSDGVDVLDSAGSLVRGNRLVRNSWNGMVLLGSARSRIEHNTLDGNKNNGAEVNGKSNAVAVVANRARGNAQTGIVVGSARGVRVVRNTTAKNHTGFLFFDLNDSLIAANRARVNEDGLVLSGGQSGSDGNRLAGNVANGNHGTGIVLVEDNAGHAAGNVLKGNTAKGNAGHGIEAVSGTIDKGGNRASGNATAPQCVKVVCSS